MRRRFCWWYCLVWFWAWVVYSAYAQTNSVPSQPNLVLLNSKEDWAKWIIATLTPVVVWLLSKTSIPVKWLPVLASLVGAGLAWLANQFGVVNFSGIDMTQTGALGVFIREVVNQWITKPMQGAPPPPQNSASPPLAKPVKE